MRNSEGKMKQLPPMCCIFNFTSRCRFYYYIDLSKPELWCDFINECYVRILDVFLTFKVEEISEHANWRESPAWNWLLVEERHKS